MKRNVLFLMALGLALLVGGCSSDSSSPNVSGTWKMVANVTYQFDLILAQDGDRITGSMVRTNGSEPTDNVFGTVDADGAVSFSRVRTGAGGWTQIYVGAVTTTAGISTMNGTFRFSTATTSAPWQATRL
jgi:hypothetical protein